MYDGRMEVTTAPVPDPLLLSVDDAARSLGISRSKFYGLMRAGVVPTVMIGGQRRVVFSDLQRYVDGLPRQNSVA